VSVKVWTFHFLSPPCLRNKSLTIEKIFKWMIFFCHHILLCTFFFAIGYSTISYFKLVYHMLLLVIIGYFGLFYHGLLLNIPSWVIVGYLKLFYHRVLLDIPSLVIVGYFKLFYHIGYCCIFHSKLLLVILGYFMLFYYKLFLYIPS